MSRILLSGDYMNGINYQNLINQTGIIAGYGYHDYEYSNKHRAQVGIHDGKLRAGKVPLWPSGWCFGIRSKICTSDYYPVAVEGDSGGPLLFQQTYYENARLVTKNYQFGIVIQTQDTSKWNLAVPIYSQCGWIEKTTKGAAKCKYVFEKGLDIINRRRRSITPSPSLLSLKKESSNVQHFKDEKNVISDSNILASKNDISKPLQNWPKNELKEYKEMDAEDLFCILNCINIIVLFCLAVLLCYYFCFKGERNVELSTAVQKV
uniref:Peptidase S1 domain-containing protein n=1 Tax=Panagrolaimus davidi TaxID=227884 RepID=A0A914Q4D9_9BILA